MSNKLMILLIGGSGFIGKGIIKELLSRQHTIIATYCQHKPNDISSNNLIWTAWDATQKPLPEINWEGIDAILHLANYWDLNHFPSNARPVYQILVNSTFELLEKASQQGISRFIMSSTGAVLKNIERYNEEDSNYGPMSFYAASKACAEMITSAYSSLVSTAIVRFYYPYGPGGDRYLICRLIRSVLEGKEITIEGQDGIMINPVYLSDLAKGLSIAIESDHEGIFHLAGPDKLSLRSFLELVGKITGRKAIIKSTLKDVPGGHASLFKRSKTILGYNPTVTIKEGLEKTISQMKWRKE